MRVFLSYRRLDSTDFAGRCFEYFSGRFGRRSVFWDCRSIPPDRDWLDFIRREIEASDVVLIIVGPQWDSILQERLNDEIDHVRFEVEYAARMHRPVVVLLVDGAAAPREVDLPEGLKFLGKQQVEAFDASHESESFRRLENRLLQFAPSISPQDAWSQADLAKRPWVDRGLETPPVHPSWWELWNLHDPDVVQRITGLLSEHSTEPGLILLSGPENCGRRYLVDAAVRQLRKSGSVIQLLRINLDGYEVDQPDLLEAYLRQQAKRLGIDSDRGFEQLSVWLKQHLGDGVHSVNTCASVGMLLELSGSYARVLQILEGINLRPGMKEHARLLVCLLEHFATKARTIVHVDESIIPFTLRDDLMSFSVSLPQLRLVFSTLPDVDVKYIAGARPSVRVNVSAPDQEQLSVRLTDHFASNAIPSWLPRLLWQESHGNRGLMAWQLIQLFQEEALQWDESGFWAEGTVTRHADPSTSLTRLLRPLASLFQSTPHLEELLRLAALCGELIPLNLLMDFLRIPSEDRDALLDVIDDQLCESEQPILEDLGFDHPGFSTGRKVNVYRFHCPLDIDLLLLGPSDAWRQSKAAELLKFFEHILPASTRSIANVYLQLCDVLPDDGESRLTWEEKLQWWISEREGDRFREHVTKAINDGRLSGESVWQAIQRDDAKGSPARKLNLLLGYEEQKDGIPYQHASSFYTSKGVRLHLLARFGEAEFYFREALRIDEQFYGPDHPDVATHLNNLAALLKITNRQAEAEPLMRRALAIHEQSYGAEHPGVATNLNNLAALLLDTNRLTEAEALMRRALAIDEEFYGAEHADVARDLNNLAQLLKATNRLTEAEPLMRRVVDIFEQSYGAEHPYFAGYLNNLAGLLKATNRLAEAEPLIRRALAIDEQSYGAEHPIVARELNSLALLLKATNRLAEAERLIRRALAIDEQSYGAEHPSVATKLNNLALLLQATNRLAEAEPLMRRVVEIFEKDDPEIEPNYARSLNNLAWLLQATNRLAEAEPLMRRALAIDEQSYGAEHPDVAIDLNNLSLLLQATNRLAEAEPLMRRVVEILLKFTQATGHAHLRLERVLGNYSQLLQAMGMNDAEVHDRLSNLCGEYGMSLG